MLSPSNDDSSESKNYELITVNQFASEAECKGQAAASIATGNWSKDCSLSGGVGTEDVELQQNDLSTTSDRLAQKRQRKSDREKGRSLHLAGSVGSKESTTNR